MMESSSRCVVPPATEPLSLDEVKEHLRIDSSAEDALLQMYMEAAREICEHHTARALITQTWETTFDRFPGLALEASGVDGEVLDLQVPFVSAMWQALAVDGQRQQHCACGCF
ncbi:MAG: phage gp6-like head-tail connector protein [Betaproteobacteria bacterium]|nr:phage gp6-like head-tail connector protein [Betaproteobacteria bacterium]